MKCDPADDDGYGWPDVHGGLTYCGACQKNPTGQESKGICHVPLPGRSAEVWWFGFDCAHGSDIAPGMVARERSMGFAAGLSTFGESYKTVGYVQRECAKLAAQLVTAHLEG